VDVIRHQAIAQQLDAPVLAMGSEHGQADSPIGVGEEGFLAVVPALSDVVRCADRRHARNARHERRLSAIARAAVTRMLRRLFR
jgi:hypothetical protein